jgi:NADH-ubiquinone oxidoreductase chain 5
MVCHALFKALLFLRCGGFIYFSSGGQDIRQRGGYISITPFFCIMFVFSSLRLCGFPFLSGFYSKDFILESSFGLR